MVGLILSWFKTTTNKNQANYYRFTRDYGYAMQCIQLEYHQVWWNSIGVKSTLKNLKIYFSYNLCLCSVICLRLLILWQYRNTWFGWAAASKWKVMLPPGLSNPLPTSLGMFLSSCHGSQVYSWIFNLRLCFCWLYCKKTKQTKRSVGRFVGTNVS